MVDSNLSLLCEVRMILTTRWSAPCFVDDEMRLSCSMLSRAIWLFFRAVSRCIV